MKGSLNQTSMALGRRQLQRVRWAALSLLGTGLGCVSLNFLAPEIVLSQPGKTPQNPGPETTVTGGPDRSILRAGSKGNDVSELQATLKLLGYYGGAVDGVYGDTTVTAVSLFQQAAGLNADGVTGPATWNRLFPPSPPVATTAPTPTASHPSHSPSNSQTARAGTPPVSSTSTSKPTSSIVSNPVNPPIAAGSSDLGTEFPSPSGLSASAAQPAVNVPPINNSVPKPPTNNSNPKPTVAPPKPRSPQGAIATNSPPPATNELLSFPILRLGMKGPAVTGLQHRLRAIGFLKSPADGVFGAETQEAVKAAQRKFKLEADGVVGPSTWIELMQ